MNDTEKKKAAFIKAGGVIPSYVKPEVEKSDTSQLHYNKVLNNSSKEYWLSADGRTNLISTMPNEYLINVMRWLIKNHLPIAKYITETINSLPYMMRVRILSMLQPGFSAPSFYSYYLPCFDTLAEEIQKRFGNEALRSLYDGN